MGEPLEPGTCCIFCPEPVFGASPDLGDPVPVPHSDETVCGHVVHPTCAQQYSGSMTCPCQRAVDWVPAEAPASEPAADAAVGGSAREWITDRFIGYETDGTAIFSLRPGETAPTPEWLGLTAANFEMEEDWSDAGSGVGSSAPPGPVWESGRAQGKVTPCVVCDETMTIDLTKPRGIVGHAVAGCGQFAHATCAQKANLMLRTYKCGCDRLVRTYESADVVWSAGQELGTCAVCNQGVVVGVLGSLTSNVVSPIYRPIHFEPCGRYAHPDCIPQAGSRDCPCGRGRIYEILDADGHPAVTDPDEETSLRAVSVLDPGYGTFGRGRTAY